MIFLITFFAIVHSSNGDYAASYEGMDKTTITRLERERGNTIEFVDQATHNAFVIAHEVRPSAARETIKKEALETINRSTATTDQKVDALIQILDLDK